MLLIDQKIFRRAKKGIRNCPFNLFLFQSLQKGSLNAQNVFEKKSKYLAFCGIGTPENFFNLLNENGYLLCDDVYFNRSETHHILNYLQNEKIIQVSYILKRVSNIFSANPFIRKHIAIIKKT